VVADTIQEFLDHFNKSLFTDPLATVKPRFDGTTVPPGTERVRAELETPESKALVHLSVMGADDLIVDNRRLPVDSVSESGDEYVFTLDDPLPFPLTDGQFVEVETTDFIDDLFKTQFPTDWAQPFDDFFADLAANIRKMEKKICRILQGRPIDVGVTAATVSLSVTGMRFTLIGIRLLLAVLKAGLEPSKVIEKALDTFKKSGMDAAADAVKAGNIKTIASMTVQTSTSEGQARESIQNYRQELVLFEDAKTADAMAASLTAPELDKELLAAHRREHKEIVKTKLQRRQEAANVLADNADSITT